MNVRTFDDPAAFLARAGPFLQAREAENNVQLGLALALVRQPALQPAPAYLGTVERAGAAVLVATLTPPFNLVLSATDVPAALDLLARDLRRRGIAPAGVLGAATVSRAFAERWREIGGYRYRPGLSQRLYRLDAVVPVAGVAGSPRRATAADRDLLIAWMGAFTAEAFGAADPERVERGVDLRLRGEGTGFWLWEDGEPVSLVGCSGRTANGIRIGPVYTPPPFRGRGYARAATAAASRDLLGEGLRFCVLFADRANPTANRLYRAIGYAPLGDVDEYRFDAAG